MCACVSGCLPTFLKATFITSLWGEGRSTALHWCIIGFTKTNSFICLTAVVSLCYVFLVHRFCLLTSMVRISEPPEPHLYSQSANSTLQDFTLSHPVVSLTLDPYICLSSEHLYASHNSFSLDSCLTFGRRSLTLPTLPTLPTYPQTMDKTDDRLP